MRARRRWRPRYLSEQRTGRLLAAGGMVLERQGSWHVCRSRDARLTPCGRISPATAARLIEDGILVEDSGAPGRWIAQDGMALPAMSPPAPAGHVRFPVFEPRRHAAPLLHAVLSDTRYPFDLRARLRAAANRFAADAEQAASSQPMTMRWDGIPAGSSGMTTLDGGPGRRARAAAARFARLEAVLGAPAMRALERLIIQDIRRKAYAEAAGVRADEAGRNAVSVLCALADAYDARVRAADG